MGNTYKQQARKFDDEQYSGRSGKHARHTNNHKFNGIPIFESWETDDELELENVESSINKE
jgi:hypothetical protein